MRRGGLDQLGRAAEAQYHQEHARIRDVLEQEASVRARLARLDAQVAQARAASQEAVMPMAAIGADMLWQAWVERTRRELNIELAQARARKLAAMGRLRTAFGRKSVIAQLQDRARSEARDQARRRAEARLLGS